MTLRRLDIQAGYGDLLRLCDLRLEHLVYPLFVSERKAEIESMPGLTIAPLGDLEGYVQRIADKRINSVILFGVPTRREADGRGATGRAGIIQKATREIKSQFGSRLVVITDVCLCQYNTTGHCGLVGKNGVVDNDSTLELLAEVAASHAEAGADIVAPSSMMDGQVYVIRNRLNDMQLRAEILAYSAKHSSSLYTPFRSAAFASSRVPLDKSSYQVSYANPRQAMREIEADIDEGADIVMVKPAMAYLDLIRMAKDRFNFPVAAQNVSGEYAMIKAAGARGLVNEEDWKVQTLASIRRAGADKIISYFAADVAQYL